MVLRYKSTIILVILVLLLVAGGVWYARGSAPQTPPIANDDGKQVVDKTENELSGGEIDTSDWKTYRNDKYGFELKMPQKWEASEKYNIMLFSENGPIGDLVNLFSSEKNIYGSPFGVRIYRIPNPEKKSLIDFFEYAHSGDRVPNPILEKVALGIDDLEFTLLYTESMSKDFFSKHFVKFINGNYFEIMYLNPGIIELNKQADEMLNTLKFN